jgi:DNA/RNA endonuclease G (NUC1)
MSAKKCAPCITPKVDAAYVKALYAKYPAVKSDFCATCELWVNPFFKSIGDTEAHMPLVEYEYFHAGETYSLKRTGEQAEWHSVDGADDENKAYTDANKDGKGEIAKGHVNCWILNSFSSDAAILSDTYTFNAAMEMQDQNIGTEIASENYERKLLLKYDVQQWGGCFGSQGQVDGECIPAYYWKIILCNGVTTCYWMPNQQTETQAELPQRVVSYEQLVKDLGFDPQEIFPVVGV